MNLALKAARKKWRFQTPNTNSFRNVGKGLLNLEQLFGLSEDQLHDLYLDLQSDVQKSKGLLGRKGNKEIEEKMDLIKSVFNVLQDEKEEALRIQEDKALKGKVLEAIAEKEIDDLKEKSIKELRKIARKL